MKNRNAQDEDVALGYVLSRSDLDVEYVGSNGRNSPYQMHNLRCSMGSAGLYRPPSDKSMVIHHVTDPAAMRYLWRVFVDGARHEPPTCEQAMAGISSEYASSKTLCDASCEQAYVLCARVCRSRECHNLPTGRFVRPRSSRL